MREVDEELILGTWQVIRDNISKPAVLKEAAIQFVHLFEKLSIDLNDYEIKGEDSYLDEAMGSDEEEQEDEEKDLYE